MQKRDFYIYQEDLIKYSVTKENVTISKLVEDLNVKYCENDMRRLRTETITNFLIKQGYLFRDKNARKRPTLKGKILGIEVGYILDEDGNKYLTNLYTMKAQKYIIDNIYDMI